MTDTLWTLQDVPLDQVVAVALVINRGIEASNVQFVVRDEDGAADQLKGKPNPVVIAVTAPDLDGNAQTLKLENWYITDVLPHGPGFLRIVVQDCRWLARQRKLTRDYNVYTSGGGTQTTARKSSLKADGNPWTCLEAAVDALGHFGLEFEADPEVPEELTKEPLPRNLGNARGGGFVGADFEAAMPVLTELMQLDMVVLPSGKITLTDRERDVATGLEKFIGTDGVVGDRDISWQKPRELICKMESRVERALHCNDASSSAEGLDIGVTMVMPRELATSGPLETVFVDMVAELSSAWGLQIGDVRRRYFKPAVIATASNDSITMAQRKRQANAWIKECFRRVFKLENALGTNTLADLRLGHMAANGSTRTVRCVYMPFSYIKRTIPYFNPGARAQDLAAMRLSENSPARGIDTKNPAPFDATWGYDNRGDIILKLTPVDVDYAVAVYPGALARPLHFGQIIDLADDATWLSNLQHDATFAAGWTAFVVYHALLTADRPDLGIKRLREERLPLFADGQVESVEYFIRDMTANYTLLDVSLWGVALANAAEITARVENIRKQVLAAFKDGKAGVMRTGGVDAIVRGKYWVKGNIYSLVIMLGATTHFSVEAQWTVMPHIRPIYLDDMQEALQGAQIRELA